MRIIGIDPGTARMGYSILEVMPRKKSQPKILKTDVLITPAGVDMHKRLHMLYDGINEIVSAHSPEIMVIEKLFFNTNVKTAITVGQARGVAMLSAAQNGLSVYEYTALEAKRLLTGYGRSSKKEMQVAVKDSLKLDSLVKSDDANDAVAIALCFIMKDMVRDL
ncbi:crossover junction endodeoxyribonuclease RuvC [candidate division WWE3 bacterium]|jgi:crossover junction endodeoxyribonuclease RuvC|uniref:Crossover junction endodeoxyribonuclease RuvC n=1 Tax=candidate division WWE3 bacterium TaxID=2053526 RepID=A0A3A4ZDL4_UNCKA|nr:MAG: crossover junction endodeoxyribonuclease RuvC [candidate division WWE3 bacterium]